jgi:CheY-like chemotaxis protein
MTNSKEFCILMIGFDAYLATALQRAVFTESYSLRFLSTLSDEGENLLFANEPDSGISPVHLVIVNGDDVGESGVIRQFEAFRLKHNCAAVIAAYAPKEEVQQAFSKRVDTDEPIIQIDCPSDACIFMPMPLSLETVSRYLQETEFRKPMEEAQWEKQKEQLKLAFYARKMQYSAHRIKNLRGADNMLNGLLQMKVISEQRYSEIAQNILLLKDAPTSLPKASASLPPSSPCILLIDDDAVTAQWGEILGELFAHTLGARLEWVTRLDEGIERLKQKGASYSALLLDVRFPEEGRSAVDLWMQEEELLKKIPVVMFSADADGHIVKTCLLDRAENYFIKDASSENPEEDCEALVEIMKSAMDEARRWIFYDAIEKAKRLVPGDIRKELISDLDDAIRYLFLKPKLALFCVASAFETFTRYKIDFRGYFPERCYYYLALTYRHIIAHNAFSIPNAYKSLDAEIVFWSLLALLNSPLSRGSQRAVDFEVEEYFPKLHNHAKAIASYSKPITDGLRKLLQAGQDGNATGVFPRAASLIGNYLLPTVNNYRTTLSPPETPFSNIDDAIEWLRKQNTNEVNDINTLLAMSVVHGERDLMSELNRLYSTLQHDSRPQNEHTALFAAICVRLFLVN